MQEDITILETQVFVDPYEEADEQLKKERENLVQQAEKADEEALMKTDSLTTAKPIEFKSGVGKYVNPTILNKLKMAEGDGDEEPAKKKPKPSATAMGQLKNFAAWWL